MTMNIWVTNMKFIVSLLDNKILVEPAYKYKKDGYREDGYIEVGGDIVYIHEDCNSRLLRFIDTRELYEFGIENFDSNCDDDSVCYH